MCGITGKLHFDRNQPVDPAFIQRMNRVITHRGPDDEGVWTAGPVGLGQRRLAIIDLSPTGHQPMNNEDGTVWITFNGEIYNHPQLLNWNAVATLIAAVRTRKRFSTCMKNMAVIA